MLKLIIPVLLLITSLVFAQKKDTYDLQKSGLQKSKNSYLDYDYKTIGGDKLEATLLKDGFFTIGTSNGTSDSQLDDNCQITYGHPFAKTSFPSIKLDGVLYKYDQLFANLSETELLEVSINGSQDEVSTSPIIHINNYNEQLNVSLNISIDEIANRIVIQQIITNIDAESHTIQPNITFDPALGKHGDGIIPLSGAFLTHEETFSPIDLLSELIVFEKGTGALGMGISFDYNGIAPETVSAQNWIGKNTTDYQQETLYDLLLKFEWEEVEVNSGEIYTTELIVNILEPSFGDVFARWDFPTFISMNEGLMFPDEFDSYLELYKSNTLHDEELSFNFNFPTSISANEPYSVTFNNSIIQFVKIPVNSKIIYENRVDEVGIQIFQNGEQIEQITRKIFIPSTPLTDTGLVVIIDSLDVSTYPDINLIFHSKIESNESLLSALTKDNIFLYENDTRITEFNLNKDTTDGVNSADIIFVLDVTGSMGHEINKVKENIKEFADELSKKGIDYRFGMITFLDNIENVYSFTNDVQLFHSLIDEQYAHGGGDGPENSLDALWKATEYNFRENAKKIIVWITDANYHENDGITSLNKTDVANKLIIDGFTVHAIGNKFFKSSEYDPILLPTGGNFYDIYGNFKDIMLDITNMKYSYKYNLSYLSNSDITDNVIKLEIHFAGLGGNTILNFTTNQPNTSEQQNALLFYPNPFNPEINFDITHENFSDGQIRIYNVLGQCVKEISFTKAATQSLKWNARNQINSQVGTGFYIVQLALKQNGNIVHHESAKILYLK